ncbi:hypothetical protein C8N46_10931 [Kordia periserrulae]|uniref:Uncharacterized protein n=1 Tax=Kordia periserrulae TaxID=701523 RepID=A0A2T6BTQ7_9FLAO|nr:hypothetical protein C8N46_10931 [Kordia periserrulae]
MIIRVFGSKQVFIRYDTTAFFMKFELLNYTLTKP